jgi:hypothetical protein
VVDESTPLHMLLFERGDAGDVTFEVVELLLNLFPDALTMQNDEAGHRFTLSAMKVHLSQSMRCCCVGDRAPKLSK